MPETPMCDRCSESDRVEPYQDQHWCNRCSAFVGTGPLPGKPTADFPGTPLRRTGAKEMKRKAREATLRNQPPPEVNKDAPEVNQAAAPVNTEVEPPRLAPIDYWLHPTRLSLELQDGAKVSADWEPRSQTLRLHGPFGAVVDRPFLRTDQASLHSCALARAEKAALDHKLWSGGQQEAEPSGENAPDRPLAACASCGASIFWVTSGADYKRRMPINAEPVADGNVVIVDGRGKVLTKRQLQEGGIAIPRYTSHFSDCPNAKGHRKSKPKE